MRILVYPHSMELGGSQLNAVDLAGALQRAGHEVVLYGDEGALAPRIAHWGLEHVVSRDQRSSPDLGRALELRSLARRRDIEVLHGWEWPPIFECWTAAGSARHAVCAVGSVMSMSVAPFLPGSVPLTVGTENIRQHTVRRPSDAPVTLLEPPVDLADNAPGGHPDPSLVEETDELRIVVVSRLVRELKLEGLLTAITVVQRLAGTFRCRLVIAGDGAAYGEVRAAADAANLAVGREVVTLLGSVEDPRPVYDAADVCLGMGGSALRSLAFAKPLVVQGEHGFFRTLTPETVDGFLRDGWYGRGDLTAEAAADHLTTLLAPLLRDADLRRALGAFGREVVESRFSLEAGVRTLEDFYSAATAARGRGVRTVPEVARSGGGLLAHKLRRRHQRRLGTAAVDDFNARPV